LFDVSTPRTLPKVDLPEYHSAGGDAKPENVNPEIKVKEADTITFEPISGIKAVRYWKSKAKRTVSGSSTRPKAAFIWMTNCESVSSWQELEDDEGFETLSAKMASGLIKVVQGQLAKEIQLIDDQLSKQGKYLNGRQIYWIICNHFKVCETQGTIIELKDLLALSLKGDNVRQFVNAWNATMNLLQNIPSDDVLECLFRAQLEKSVQLKEMLNLIDQDIVHRGAKKSYQTLMHAVQAHLNHRHMMKMRDDLDNVNTGAAGGKARGRGKGSRSQSAKPTKGDCTQFLNGGRCSKGSNCEFKHDFGKLKQLIQAGRDAEQIPNTNRRSQSSPPNNQRSGGSREGNKGGGKGNGKGKDKDGKIVQKKRGTSPSGKKDAKICHLLQNRQMCKW